jgi:prepilin-type N-terminal cleavage/methylation domain-containing protein
MLIKMKNNNKGFTIVETLIVLAIAGLIILIVLLAVPALQRNARNTDIKSDVSAIAGGITEFESNNDGSLPTTTSLTGSTLALSGGTGTAPTNAQIQGGDVIDGGATTIFTSIPATMTAKAGSIDIVSGSSCPNGGAAGVSSTRAFSLYYWIESPGATTTVGAVKGLTNGPGLEGECLDT